MGRKPCCDKVGLKRGPWGAEEDRKLVSFINTHGIACWRAVPKLAGLLRCGKSCRLRWTNYLRPDLKRGIFTEAEENLILELHATLGNRWSRIAVQLPGRTDNEIKNYWNTRLKKRLRNMGLDPNTHKPVDSGTGGDTETVDGDDDTCSEALSSHSETPEIPLVSPQVSEAAAVQLKTCQSEGEKLTLPETPKSDLPICNLKQSKSGLQSSSSDDVSAKCNETSSPNHVSCIPLENYHVRGTLQYTAQHDPKFEVEDDLCMGGLHPHAQHIKQMGNLLNSHDHERVAASGGFSQEGLLRQTSGFILSDMAVGNWSLFGEIGQSLCYGASNSSWSDHGFVQPAGVRPSQELQKLAAVLDQI